MLLEGTLVLDKNKDTLLYAGVVNVNITDWFFFKDKIELKYIGLAGCSSSFQPHRFRLELSVHHGLLQFARSCKKTKEHRP